MASRDDIIIEITPQVLLKAYTCGIFPMAESADDPALYWIEPQQRGILLLDQVHVPRRLARTIRQGAFEVRIDSDFEGVLDGCAASRAGPAHHLDQPQDQGALPRPVRRAATATRWRRGRAGSWSAASTAWPCTAPSSARACSPPSATPARWRSSTSCARLHARRLLAARHAVRHRASEAVRHHRDRAATFHTLLEKALAHQANFQALPSDASPERVLDIVQGGAA